MDKRKQINCVITDLDNTIWDWFDMWYQSFFPYINRISNELNVPMDELKNDFKKLHQKYGSSEASFLYNELETLDETKKKQIAQSINGGKSIIHEYNSSKKHGLFLYDGVRETLEELKKSGILIIGFTESNDFFTKYRLKQLQLDGLFDIIYAPIAFELPKGYRYYPENYWEPEITEFRYLPKEIKKPAPQILEIILKDFSINKENAIYVGDKLEKDIRMANIVGIDSVLAEYGNHVFNTDYELLREVTHWTDDEVKQEKEIEKSYKERCNVVIPQFVLKKSLSEILDKFTFRPFINRPDKRNISAVLSIWEKVIEVQQHFNDIELRIRNLALTAFTFILGAIGYVETKDLSIRVCKELTLPYSSLVAFLGAIIVGAFYFMDKYWYHRLLDGAVKQAKFIEDRWKKYYPEIALTQKIGETSPIKIFNLKMHSKHKCTFFYALLFCSLIIICILLIKVHIIVKVLIWLVFALFSGYVGWNRKIGVWLALLIGLVIGPFGLIFAFSSDKKSEIEKKRI